LLTVRASRATAWRSSATVGAHALNRMSEPRGAMSRKLAPTPLELLCNSAI